MDKLYYLLECHRLLLGHPQLPALRAKVALALDELEADTKAAAAKATEAAQPKAIPATPAPPAPTVERKI